MATCATCRYLALPDDMDPCRECSHNHVDKWQPADDATSGVTSEVPVGPEPASRHIYICSPYAGYTAINRYNAIRYAKYCRTITGGVPFVPHLMYPQYLDDANDTDRKLAMEAAHDILRTCCSEMWVCGDVLSEGMRTDIAEAIAAGIPVRFRSEREITQWEEADK